MVLSFSLSSSNSYICVCVAQLHINAQRLQRTQMRSGLYFIQFYIVRKGSGKGE